jgi:hypothetical protein
MVKVFEKNGKINFIDSNNVVLGYDMNQSCCEDADYLFTDNSKEAEDAVVYNLDNRESPDQSDFVFDVDYIEEIDNGSLDSGGMVAFKMVAEGKEMFVVLYNCHNGYYGHGFNMELGDKTLHEGTL